MSRRAVDEEVDRHRLYAPLERALATMPERTATPTVVVDRVALDRPGFELVGVMTYEGQVAGVSDPVVTEVSGRIVETVATYRGLGSSW